MLGIENCLAAYLIVGNLVLVVLAGCVFLLTRFLEFVTLWKLATYLRTNHKQQWTHLGFDMNDRPSVSVILRRRRNWFSHHGDSVDSLVGMMKIRNRRLNRMAKRSLILLLLSILLFVSIMLLLVTFGLLHAVAPSLPGS